MAKHIKKCAATFGILGFVSLLGLCSESVLILLEQFIYDKTYNKFTITESITHWLIISGLWGILGLVLFYVSARVYNFNFSKKKNLPSERGWIVAVLLFLTAFGVKFRIYGGWKLAADFTQSGWFQFIFQYIYYLFQAIMILMLVVFAQEATDRALKTHKIRFRHIPWGGIILAATWGTLHLATEANFTVAICCIILSLLAGAAHLAVNKNVYISYVLTVLILLICKCRLLSGGLLFYLQRFVYELFATHS